MKKFIESNSHIIIALDTENLEQGFRVMDECYDLVDCIKLNYPLVLKEGIGIIGKLKDRYNLPIFCDFKIADVPVTNNKIIKIASDAGGDIYKAEKPREYILNNILKHKEEKKC